MTEEEKMAEFIKREIEIPRRKAQEFICAVRALRPLLSDEQAYYVRVFYPDWEPGLTFHKDERINYLGSLYRVKEYLLAEEDKNPMITPALYEKLRK